MRHDVLPESETNLLQIIHAPIAPDARKERDTLLAEQMRRELTEKERDMLADLIDVVEIANAERWQGIVELAQRRGISLSEIAQELNLFL